MQCLGSDLHKISYFLHMVWIERVEIRSTFNNINIRNMIFMVWTQTKENNITIQDITHLWYRSFVLMTFPFPLWNSSFQIQDGLKKEITKSKKKILKSFNYSERTSNLKALRENCQNPESFLVRIFLHLDRIQGNMKKKKTKKKQKKIRTWTLFTQWMILNWKAIQSRNLSEADANRNNNHKHFFKEVENTVCHVNSAFEEQYC